MSTPHVLLKRSTATSSVMELCLIHVSVGCHVTILCACILLLQVKNGVPSKARVQNVLKVLRKITRSSKKVTGWCTAQCKTLEDEWYVDINP